MSETNASAMSTEPAPWSSVAASIAQAPSGATVSVAVDDLTCGASFGHQETVDFPAASTIKLLILVAVARAIDNGRFSIDAKIPILSVHKVGGSGVLNWLETGLELALHDLAWLMIAISDNTASNVLIDAVGFPAIHDAQRSLGLAATSLNRRFLGCLPTGSEAENVTCARDLTTLLRAIDDRSAATAERCEWMLRLLGDQQHKDRLARFLPDGVSFAGKSGSLRGLCHDSGIIRGSGGAAAIAVLTKEIDDPYLADDFIGTVGAAVVDDLRMTRLDGTVPGLGQSLQNAHQ